MSEQLVGGMAGLSFVDDMISLLNTSWVSDNGGAKPEIVKTWENKETGMADNNYAQIQISIDSENPQIYSILQGNDGNNPAGSNYDWLHDISITLDVRTGVSQNRVNELVNEILRILKTNVVPTINNNDYIRILPEGLTSMNEEYRNLFRYIISVSAIRFNP